MNEIAGIAALIAQFMIPIGTEKVRYGAILRHGPRIDPKNPDGKWLGYDVELFNEHTEAFEYVIENPADAAATFDAIKQVDDLLDTLQAQMIAQINATQAQPGAKP